MNTVETCSAGMTGTTFDAALDATMNLAVAMGGDEFPALPAILIENGASHTYAIYGTGAELMEFAERFKRQAQRVIDGERDQFGQYNYTAYRRTLDRPDEAAPWFLLSDEEKGRFMP